MFAATSQTWPRTKDYETWHRVYCRASCRPRLHVENGVVYWLIDTPNNAPVGAAAAPDEAKGSASNLTTKTDHESIS